MSRGSPSFTVIVRSCVGLRQIATRVPLVALQTEIKTWRKCFPHDKGEATDNVKPPCGDKTPYLFAWHWCNSFHYDFFYQPIFFSKTFGLERILEYKQVFIYITSIRHIEWLLATMNSNLSFWFLKKFILKKTKKTTNVAFVSKVIFRTFFCKIIKK